MESRTISLNHHLMQRTATLARDVLERAKTRKLNWPLPARFRSKTRKGGKEDTCLEAAFASVAEHMGHISEECENYYCCVPPFQFKEHEVAHIFRYHSRQASENLLKAFRDEENKASPIVEQPEGTSTEICTLSPAETSKDIFIEVSPGTYSVSASSYDDKFRQTHLVKIQPGESVNLSFDL